MTEDLKQIGLDVSHRRVGRFDVPEFKKLSPNVPFE